MSDPVSLASVAKSLRPVSKDVLKGKGKLCLSTVFLNKLNKAFDENIPEDLTSSFHLTEAKASLQIDLQFLHDIVKGTVALKITPDLVEQHGSNLVNLRRFQNVKTLEIHKVNIKNIIGIQKLRSHIEDLTCMYNLGNLEDILDKCGGDNSDKFNWGELKRINFSHNRIPDIDTGFEATPWLQILDLSHNHIKNLEIIDHMPNLKRLNLSYNKLEKVPRFKGQICKRLQVLLLNNNFVEDISSLSTLSDLQQLDLAQNCILDHNSLLSVSQMPCLNLLDLRGNPINFDPQHRSLTCNYLNKNTATLNFVLDNIPLNKMEKSLAGAFYPIPQGSLRSNESYASQNSLEKSIVDRKKKVRNVPIQEGYKITDVTDKKKDCFTPSPSSSDTSHLDFKSKIEQLRKEHGAAWLSHSPGKLLQDVLKFPESPKILTSTPTEEVLASSPKSDNISHKSVDDVQPNSLGSIPELPVHKEDTNNTTLETFETCPVNNEKVEENGDDLNLSAKAEDLVNVSSDDTEILGGEFFVGGTIPDSNNLFIVITDAHISEIDSVTTKEKARWHMNIVKSCQQGDSPSEIKIVFNTMRTDRMSRTYYLEDPDKFVKLVFEGMMRNKEPESRVHYQCIKCSLTFSRTKKPMNVHGDEKVTCPQCGSNFVIESK